MAVETTTAAKPATDKADESNIKETIESILVAFILAFVFRAFVVEAFVIPTGSMGTTLMGAHMRLTCPDCGYHFAVNYNTGDPDGNDAPAEGARRADFICPNCGFYGDVGQMKFSHTRSVRVVQDKQ